MKKLIGLLVFGFVMQASASIVVKKLNITVLTAPSGTALASSPIHASLVYGDTDSPALQASIGNINYTLTSSDNSCLSTLFSEELAAGKAQIPQK